MGVDPELRITERRSHEGNARGKWDRRDDPIVTTWPQLAYELARRYGLWALVAIGLLYFLVGDVRGTEQRTYELLARHAYESNWMGVQSCRNLAILAGTRPELCEPPLERPEHPR